MSARQLTRKRAFVAFAAVIACVAATPAAALALERPATPATFASVFAAAQTGDTVLMATGNYGIFSGALKAGEVVLRPQPGASARIELRFNPASNITLDGVIVTDADIAGSQTKNITVRNADVPGQITIRTDELQNANILLDRNVHHDWNKTDDCRCGEGRISVLGQNDQPNGVTIQNSEFRGGMSDGVQVGSRGTRILNNTFHDLVAGTPDGVHTDAIQLYGSQQTLIRGNLFYNVGGTAIMAPDGADHETIEDNVIGPGGYPFAITLYSDDGSVLRHNTLAPGSCDFNLPCGILRVGSKSSCSYASECDAGRGTVIEDNIFADISEDDGSAAFTSRYNLFSAGGPTGSNDLRGNPTFVGGPNAKTFDGYALAAGSPGRGNASDGRDRGIRVSTGGGTSGGGSVSSRTTVRVVSTLRSITRTARLRLRIRTAAAGSVVISGAIRPGKARRGARGHSRRLLRLRPASRGTLTAGARTISIKLSRTTRRMLNRSRDARLSVSVRVGTVTTRSKMTIKRGR